MRIDLNRRKFLKFILLGAGIVILREIFSLFRKTSEHKLEEISDGEIIEIGEFKARKGEKEIIFYNKEGDKIFILNKDGEIIIGD